MCVKMWTIIFVKWNIVAVTIRLETSWKLIQHRCRIRILCERREEKKTTKQGLYQVLEAAGCPQNSPVTPSSSAAVSGHAKSSPAVSPSSFFFFLLFLLSLFFCPAPLSLLVFVFLSYLCFQSLSTWLYWKGKQVSAISFFRLAQRDVTNTFALKYF